MSTREIVAISRGELLTLPPRALRLAWGLASASHVWLHEKAPLALPELPADVADLVDIPYAVSKLGRDGRYDLHGLDDDGHRSCQARDHWRPDVRVGPRSLVWRPLEMDRASIERSGRELGRREIEIEAINAERFAIRWDTGGKPSRFVGRAVLAAIGTIDLRHASGLLQWRPVEPDSWWALPVDNHP